MRTAKSFVVPPLGGNCGLKPAKAGTTNDFAVFLRLETVLGDRLETCPTGIVIYAFCLNSHQPPIRTADPLQPTLFPAFGAKFIEQ
jgi:hypothetical protein